MLSQRPSDAGVMGGLSLPRASSWPEAKYRRNSSPHDDDFEDPLGGPRLGCRY